MSTKYRSQWPRALRRGSDAVPCWVYGFESRRGIGVCLLWLHCIVRYRFQRRADRPYRRELPSVGCPKIVIAKSHMGSCDPELGRSATGERKA